MAPSIEIPHDRVHFTLVLQNDIIQIVLFLSSGPIFPLHWDPFTVIRMSEEIEVTVEETIDRSKQVKKVEMVEFLTSTGKIKEEFAKSLYDAGLNSWKKLIEGTEEYFVEFKGVGPAKAKVLMGLAEEKKMDLEATRPGLKEVLETVPRISQNVISALLENGYDSFESFNEKTDEDLVAIKGIGPKMSVAIINAVKDHIEKYGVEEPEEATAEVVDEVEDGPKDERSFIQRMIDSISGFFGGKKEEKPEEEKEEVKEETETSEPEEAPAEEEVVEESAKDEVKEEEPPEEIKEEASFEEEAPAEEPPEEEKEEGETSEPEETPSEEDSPKEEEKSFLDKIKAMFFGGSKKEEPKEEDAPVEDTTSEEAEAEQVEEDPPAEETATEETPSEEKVEEPAAAPINDFEDIPGVSKKVAQQLKAAGYMNIDELRDAVPEDLTMVEGIGPKTAEKICKAISK